MSSSYSFQTTTYRGLAFSEINVSETDVGFGIDSFVAGYPSALNGYGGMSYKATVPGDVGSSNFDALAWQRVLDAGAVAADSTETLVFTYSVAPLNGAMLWGIDGLTIASAPTGSGTLDAREVVTDDAGNVVSTLTWNGLSSTGAHFATGYSSLHVTLTLTSSVGASGGAATFSSIRQGWAYAGIGIDKQISTDGVHWLDVGNGNLLDNPNVTVGTTLYERTIVTNNGNMAVKGASVSDTQFGSFLFAGNSSINLAATFGATAISDIRTFTATESVLDTATVSGTAVSGTATLALTASDTAGYSVGTPGITIDDQVSFNGSTWLEVGPGLSNPTTLAGGPVYYRSIVSNTGGAALSGVTLTDSSGETLGVSTLAVGESVTSSVVTLTAAAGHGLDTASVSGTAAAHGVTQAVSATDTADYSAVTPAITIDDQVSFNGSTWLEVGPGLSNPTTLAGGPVYYRSIVSNTGGAALSGVTLTDSSGETLGVSTLAVGESVTSSVVTLTAAAGHGLDTASVSGTASAQGVTQAVSATDTADYSAVTPAITIDDQVSFNGSTWLEVGPGLSNPTTLAGGPVYYRSIVSNTGGAALSGVTLTDSSGETLGVSTLAVGESVTSSVVTLTAAAGHGLDTASVSGTASAQGVTQAVSATDTADYSAVTPAITIDDQVSFNGSTWLEVGPGLSNPTTLAGGPVYYRSIVSNTGGAALSGVTLTDSSGETLGVSTLAVGESVTSSVVTLTAAAGHGLDTASVSGTASAQGVTQAVSATDTADYSAVTPAITIDDQVSFNGSTWLEVGPGLSNPTTLAGGPVYYRSIVSNTGGAALSGVTLTDSSGETLGVSTLTVGQSVTSSVVTLTAAAGHGLDTASVSGTASAQGVTQAVSATDTADYSAVTPAITIDDQVSFNGSTWLEVGPGLSNPTTLAGGPVYYRSIVSNTGGAALSGVTLTDSSGETLGVSTLAVGESVTSSVVTLTAAAGHGLDTASVRGTASAQGVTQAVSATDTADYSAVTPAITIDDQVSFNGSTWLEVGPGLSNPTTLAGGPVYYRSIVSNTGGAALSGVTLTDSSGETLGVSTLAVGESATSSVVTLTAAAGHGLDTASVSGTASAQGVTQAVSATDTADYSAVTPAITIDDQVSFNGSTWLEVGPGLSNPTTLAGGPVYYRSIVSNTCGAALSGVTLTDSSGETLGVSTLAVGQSVTSSVVTLTAAAGHGLDTASVSGTASAQGVTQAVSATDTADYSAVTPAITIDDQVSFNGSTWLEVGPGLSNPTTLAGGPVYYRSIVSNTGGAALSGVTLTDSSGETLGVSTLAVGQSVTSSVVTLTAAAGHGLDTASVSGTASAQGITRTVSATDMADYSAAVGTPAIHVTKAASTPATTPGTSVTYTYTVANTGGVNVTGLTLVDDNATTLTTADNFSPTYVSGDSNRDGILNPGETWNYRATVVPATQLFTYSGSTSGAVTGNAAITMGNGYIIVQLTNMTTNTVSDAQEITSFVLGLSQPLSGSATLSSASGRLISIASGGAVTPVTGTINHWSATGGGSTINLNSLIGGKPNDGIIGLADANGKYSSANASVIQHLPDIQGTGTFYISAPGVTAATKVTSATFGFSTAAGVTLTGSSDSILDTNVVTATGTAGAATVQDTATASVVVGPTGGSTGVQVGGAAPSGNLYSSSGVQVEMLELKYLPGSQVAAVNAGTVAGVTGATPASSAFIVLSNSASDYSMTAATYFKGQVSAGDMFYADASKVGGIVTEATFAGQTLYAHIFASAAAYAASQAAVQEIRYDVSGAHAIGIGDTVGSLKLVGFVDSAHQGYVV